MDDALRFDSKGAASVAGCGRRLRVAGFEEGSDRVDVFELGLEGLSQHTAHILGLPDRPDSGREQGNGDAQPRRLDPGQAHHDPRAPRRRREEKTTPGLGRSYSGDS